MSKENEVNIGEEGIVWGINILRIENITMKDIVARINL